MHCFVKTGTVNRQERPRIKNINRRHRLGEASTCDSTSEGEQHSKESHLFGIKLATQHHPEGCERTKGISSRALVSVQPARDEGVVGGRSGDVGRQNASSSARSPRCLARRDTVRTGITAHDVPTQLLAWSSYASARFFSACSFAGTRYFSTIRIVDLLYLQKPRRYNPIFTSFDSLPNHKIHVNLQS